MYQRGQLYHLTNFQESPGSKPKDRYCIILEVMADEISIVFHKFTSQEYGFKKGTLVEGKNSIDDFSDVYFIPKNKVIGVKGFKFSLDTYLYLGVWNVSKLTISDFEKFKPKYIDNLASDIYEDLLYFVYKSNQIKINIKEILEKTCESVFSTD
jgi:hypothetical protein